MNTYAMKFRIKFTRYSADEMRLIRRKVSTLYAKIFDILRKKNKNIFRHPTISKYYGH